MKRKRILWLGWITWVLALIFGGLASAFLAAPLFAAPTLAMAVPDLIKGIPSGYVTLGIGAIAGSIAYQQMLIANEQRRVASDKLSFDLFKERYQIFEATRSAILAFEKEPHHGFNLGDAVHRAHFLFGPEIPEYLNSLREACESLQNLRSEVLEAELDLAIPYGAEDSRVKGIGESESWLRSQSQIGAAEKFKPYLDFSQWRPGSE